MKQLIAAVLTVLALNVQAAPDRELTPEQKFYVADAATALIVGPFAVMWAVLTGNQKTLCDMLGGVYTPNSDGKDVCPGGIWLRIISYLPDRKE